MADICMCKGTGCPMRNTCYRFTATPDAYQSYFDKPPIEDGECDFHWHINDKWGQEDE